MVENAIKIKNMSNPKHSITEIGPSTLEYERRVKSNGTIRKFSSKKDLTRFVKWPKYIRIQRQRRIFCQKLKIPPAIFQFTRSLDKNMTNQLFQLLSNYKQNDSSKNIKSFKKDFENKQKKNPISIRHGINTVAKLVKNQKSLFVLIAHDVNPIDCIIWMPTLCVKMGIPYCIVKNKSKLGSIVNRKTTSCLTLTYMNSKNNGDLEKLIDCFRNNFNERYSDAIKRWGGGTV